MASTLGWPRQGPPPCLLEIIPPPQAAHGLQQRSFPPASLARACPPRPVSSCLKLVMPRPLTPANRQSSIPSPAAPPRLPGANQASITKVTKVRRQLHSDIHDKTNISLASVAHVVFTSPPCIGQGASSTKARAMICRGLRAVVPKIAHPHSSSPCPKGGWVT